MIKIENIQTQGFDVAIRGMRNPLNSWARSDSYYKDGEYIIGENDLVLMKRLCKSGPEHRKFLRMITVYRDITAPMYWWSEYDTYKVGTVANSCSKMHKLAAKEFAREDFSCEHIGNVPNGDTKYSDTLDDIISALNKARTLYLETKDKKYWWQMLQLLPASYNQRRTVMINYEVVATMIHQREHHKLNEWLDFVAQFKQIPYYKELMGEDNE